MMTTISLISNIVFEPYWHVFVKNDIIPLGSDVKILFIPYDELNYSLDLSQSDLVIVCLNFEILYPNISTCMYSEKMKSDDIIQDCIKKCNNLYSLIKNNACCKIIWFGFEDYYIRRDIIYGNIPILSSIVDRINLSLMDVFSEDVFIDLKRLIANIGIKNAYDTRGRYRWNSPYSTNLTRLMAEEIKKQ